MFRPENIFTGGQKVVTDSVELTWNSVFFFFLFSIEKRCLLGK